MKSDRRNMRERPNIPLTLTRKAGTGHSRLCTRVYRLGEMWLFLPLIWSGGDWSG